MIQSSPVRSARVRRPATSDPPAGSENSWHQIFAPDASGGRYFRFWSSPANAIMVGPHMPWPMMNTALSLPKAPSSCCQITRSIGVAPRPPYSFGQCRQAQPASAFFFCQAFATSRMLAPLSWERPSEDLRKSSSYCFGALAAIQTLASARNAASRGGSSKLMRVVPLSCIALAHPVDQRVFPIRKAAERQCHRVGAAVIQVAVEFPGKTHPPMHLDVVLGAMLECLRRADARGSRGLRQFRGVGRERPGAVIAIRTRQRRRDIHVGEHMFYGMDGAA